MSSLTLYERIARHRASLLLDLNPPKDPDDLKYSIIAAREVGCLAGAIPHYFALPKKFGLHEYVEHIVEPMYLSGMCGTCLYDSWRNKAGIGPGPERRTSDPRVRAFVNAANRMVQTRGDK